MNKLVIIGGRGNGTVVCSTVEDINAVAKRWEILGFMDDHVEGALNGYPVLGAIHPDVAARYLDDPEVLFYWALVTVRLREEFTARLRALGIPRERFATLVHPTAVVSRFAKLGRGVSVQPLVNVGPNAELGDHVQVFAQAMVGHDATLERYSYVANNACVGAHVRLREGAYLGTNASTLENIELGRWSLVGMGSVVIRSVPDHAKVVGNPARILGDPARGGGGDPVRGGDGDPVRGGGDGDGRAGGDDGRAGGNP